MNLISSKLQQISLAKQSEQSIPSVQQSKQIKNNKQQKQDQQDRRMKVKNLHSPRSKLFNFNNSSTTSTTSKLKKDVLVLQKHNGQINNGMKKPKSTTMPISINQFRRKENNLTLIVKQSQFIVKKNQPNNMLLDNKRVQQQQQSKSQQLLLKTSQKQQQTFHNNNNNNTIRRYQQNKQQKSHSSSRKRRSKYFLNLSLKKRQSSSQNTYKQNNYITAVMMMTNRQSQNSQSTAKLYCHSNRSYCYNNNRSLDRNQSRNKYSDGLDQLNMSGCFNRHYNDRRQFHNNQNNINSKYESIRNTMKKLKNLSQIKLIQTKKSQRLNTSNDQWEQISKIVEQVCSINKNRQQKNIRVSQQQMNNLYNNNDDNDVDDRVDFTNQQQQQSQQQLDQKHQQQQKQKQQQKSKSNQKQQLVTQNNNLNSQQKFPKSQNINQNQNQNLNQKQKQQLQQQQQQNINSNNNNNHQQIIHQQQQQQQYYINKFNSLILVFESIFYHNNNNNINNNLDNIIVTAVFYKIHSLCSNYQIQSTTALNLFVKHYYLQRKYIQFSLQKLYTQIVQYECLTTNRNKFIVYGFKQSLDKIQKSNQILHDFLLTNNQPICNYKQHIFDTLQHTQTYINNQNPQFIAQNMKMLRRILKKISKNYKTNQNQFHIFLNYAAYFINLTKGYNILKNILINQQKPYIYQSNTKQQQQQQQQQIKRIPLFLYTQCGFIRMSYLQMDERQFSKCFQNQKEHQNVQAYYNQLIRELKHLQPGKRQSR